MKRILAILVMLMMVFSVTACSDEEKPAENSDSITVTDMADRTVTIDGTVDKVVVSEWSIAEVMFSVLGEDAVDMLAAVGTTKNADVLKAIYSEDYPQLASMPEIGGGKDSYDTEAIIATDPDVFIVQAMDVNSLADVIDVLDDAGIPTVVFTASDDPIGGPQAEIKLVGQIFGAEDSADELTGFINTQFDLVESKNLAEKADKPSVYVELGSGTTDDYGVTFTSGQWAPLVEMAGGENVAAGAVEGNTQIDPEYLINANPDYIFIAGDPALGGNTDEIDALFDIYVARTGWDTLTAVKNDDVYHFDHTQCRNELSFYPALIMAKLFYPDEFTDVDPDQILQEFFDKYMLLDYEQGVWFTQINN